MSIVYQNDLPLYLRAMKTSAEIRRENARRLAAEIGSPADLARRLEMSDSQMGQLIGRNPVRNIGPKIARRIEEVCGRPTGWLDVDHGDVTPTSLTEFQQREAKAIIERLSDVDLSRALLWLQELASHGREGTQVDSPDIKRSSGGRRIPADHKKTG